MKPGMRDSRSNKANTDLRIEIPDEGAISPQGKGLEWG